MYEAAMNVFRHKWLTMARMETGCNFFFFEKPSGCQFLKGSSLAHILAKMLQQCGLSSRNSF